MHVLMAQVVAVACGRMHTAALVTPYDKEERTNLYTWGVGLFLVRCFSKTFFYPIVVHSTTKTWPYHLFSIGLGSERQRLDAITSWQPSLQ